MTDLEIRDLKLWAWVGLDDLNYTGVLGLKQGRTPAGIIPLVACVEGKMTQQYIREQMQMLAKLTGVKRYLVRFRFEAVVEEVPSDTREACIFIP